MTEKQKAVKGGNEDGIGIAQDVVQSSSELNDRDNATSNAGKIIKKPAFDLEKK